MASISPWLHSQEYSKEDLIKMWKDVVRSLIGESFGVRPPTKEGLIEDITRHMGHKLVNDYLRARLERWNQEFHIETWAEHSARVIENATRLLVLKYPSMLSPYKIAEADYKRNTKWYKISWQDDCKRKRRAAARVRGRYEEAKTALDAALTPYKQQQVKVQEALV